MAAGHLEQDSPDGRDPLSVGLQLALPRFVGKGWFFPSPHTVSAFPWIHSTFGELKTVRLPKKMAGTGSHRGFGFVDFVTKQDAKVSCAAVLLALPQPGGEGGSVPPDLGQAGTIPQESCTQAVWAATKPTTQAIMGIISVQLVK